MTNNGPTLLTDYRQQQTNFQHTTHLKLMWSMVCFVTPAMVVVYGLQLYNAWVWQNWATTCGAIISISCWVGGYYLAKQGQTGLSVGLLIFSATLVTSLSMFLTKDAEATSGMVLLTVVAYAATMGRNYLLRTSSAVLIIFCAAAIAKYLEMWPMLSREALPTLLSNLVFGVLTIPILAFLVRRQQVASERMLDELQEHSGRQTKIIQAARQVSQTLSGVSGRIKEVSVGFAEQAKNLANITQEGAAVLLEVERTAGTTSKAATETRGLADQTREAALEGTQQLQAVEKGFSTVVEQTEKTQEEFSELAKSAERVEEILRGNREIAGQIKILSTNAAIQAAKAGEYGKGFAVVAGELRALIERTDNSLRDSRSLLEAIRDNSRHSSTTLQSSSELLHRQLGELSSTGAIIEQIAQNFVATSDRVDNIADSMESQQLSISELNVGMGQIGEAAHQLTDSTNVLLEMVQSITSSNRMLEDVLGAGESSTEVL